MVVLEGAANIGWAAALCAIVANGSFAVPVKSETCRRLDIDPLVFQTYKTIICLCFSFTVVSLLEVPIQFSYWGILSGLFWVPGGASTVAAIKLLGLSLAVAVGNSLIALVSFSWGIFFFEEKVKSKPMACLAVFLMIIGFVGMSFFSSQDQSKNESSKVSLGSGSLREPLLPLSDAKQSKVSGSKKNAKKVDDDISLDGTLSETDSDDDSISVMTSNSKRDLEGSQHRRPNSKSPTVTIRNRKSALLDNSSTSISDVVPARSELPSIAADLPNIAGVSLGRESFIQVGKTGVACFGMEVSRFKAGLAVAAIGNTWGGSVMIGTKFCSFCQEDESGLGYLVSFAVGATLVTTALWFLRFVYHIRCGRSICSAYQALPSFHLKEMWLPGGLSGLLWSTGNLFSILAVHHLGAGVGYCVVQASMLVGGLWGVFWFGEVSGKVTVAKWFASASLTISGIILLAHQKT